MGTNHPNETCAADDCAEPTPVDMPAVILGETWLCSPDCAREHLAETDPTPDAVTLHDPQFAVDRDRLGVSEDVVDFVRETEGNAAAEDAIGEIEELFPAAFRVTP